SQKTHPFKPDATYHTMSSVSCTPTSSSVHLHHPSVLTTHHPHHHQPSQGLDGELLDHLNTALPLGGVRKRTSIAAPEKRSLEAYFAVQPRPSSEKIAAIAEKLDLKKNVVRVWFCNQRQKQKRMKFSATY
ncbi:PREDICTED: brain-specific homeobox/POU domain protein 3, partial [Nestor notabilis]|uniref:brain-specific homeobox/POU domain protein 3 n=1 Tax=Nestor notabilis TaxID=176057 RepID=UPI00052316EB